MSKKKIAILDYDNRDTLTQELQLAQLFKPSPLKIPLNLSTLSYMNTPNRTVTLAINSCLGIERSARYAISRYRDLARVIYDLSQASESDIEDVGYIKNSNNITFNEKYEVRIRGAQDWVTRNTSGICQLSNQKLLEIARWAQLQGLAGVVWVSVSSVIKDDETLALILLADGLLFINTQKYLLNLSEGPKLTLEQAIVEGIDGLKTYLGEVQSKKNGSQISLIYSLSCQLTNLAQRALSIIKS